MCHHYCLQLTTAFRDNFVAVKGKYDMVAIDYGADVEVKFH